MMVQSKTRKLSVTAMLAAVATVLMFLDFSIPIVPSFIKLDVSELPALLAAYSLGPVSGVAVCLIKNLFNLLFHGSTGGVGELCNFLLGASIVIPAGLRYQYKKNRKMAFLGALIGAAVMALFSLPLNYFVSYPVYTKFLPLDAIIEMYQAIVPGVNGLLQCLLIFNLPFTLLKGLVDTLLVFLIYKHISPLLHGRR